MTETSGSRPEHDPLAEDLDLLTTKEATARLYDELVATQELIAELERGDAEPGRVAEAQARAQNLEEAIERTRKGAAPAW